MHLLFCGGLGLALSLHHSLAGAAAPKQPTEAWGLDYGETKCTASRNYGTADKPLIFALRPSPRGNVLQLLLMRRGRVQDPEHVRVAVKLGGEAIRTTGLHYETGDSKFEILVINFDYDMIERIRGASSIEIYGRGAADEELALPDVAQVVAAMETCNRDLQEYWNIGEERTKDFQAFASSIDPLPSYIGPDDYPSQALVEGRGGKVGVTLMIDDKGVLSDCVVDGTSGVASLDAQTCGVLHKRAKFRPATDASGRPVRSIYITAVRWVIQ